jgi:hypothetical protein
MRIRCLILVTGLSISAGSTCQAGGTYRNGPMFTFPDEPKVVQAGMPSVPLPSMPHLTTRDFVGGCGRGRVLDQSTHRCRGPADIR